MQLLRFVVVLTTAALLGLPLAGRALEPAELSYDLRVDVPVTAVAMTGWLTSELLKSHLSASTCRWCDRNADGTDNLNPLDRGTRNALRWSNTSRADSLSNVTGFALAPLVALGMTALAANHEGALDRAPVDGLLIAEATALAADLNQIVKFAVGRERPFVHALPEAEKLQTAQPSDNNASFYSGHTSLVFALAVSCGTVASMRGYRYAPAVWASGLTVALATGWLRIAADKHYLTDVVTGAVVGSAVGFGVPWLGHRAPQKSAVPAVSAGVAQGGLSLAASWVW